MTILPWCLKRHSRAGPPSAPTFRAKIAQFAASERPISAISGAKITGSTARTPTSFRFHVARRVGWHTSPVVRPIDGKIRRPQHHAVSRGRRSSIISRMRRSRSRGAATSVIGKLACCRFHQTPFLGVHETGSRPPSCLAFDALPFDPKLLSHQGPLCLVNRSLGTFLLSARQGPSRALGDRLLAVDRFHQSLALTIFSMEALKGRQSQFAGRKATPSSIKKAANFAALQKVRFAELPTVSTPWPPRPVDA